jgi:hypothetical protein
MKDETLKVYCTEKDASLCKMVECGFENIFLAIQGGSDISGTLSKLHRRIKKSTCLQIILR